MYDYVVGAKEYEKGFHDLAGTDGAGVKRFGYRQQRITLSCCYVQATEDLILSTIQADFTTLCNIAFTTVIGGTSFYRCELDPASHFTHAQSTGLPSGKFYARATMVIISKGLA